MKHELEETERALEEYFAAERGRLRAPSDLWPRVDNAISQPPARFTSRWRAVAALGVAAAVIAVVLVVIAGRFGSSVPLSADQVLAGAAEALLDPQRVGLTSYQAVVEFESETEAGSLSGTSTTLSIDEASPLGEPVPVTPVGAVETVREFSRAELAFKAPGSYLIRVEGIEPAIEAGERLFVTDGDTLWSYDSISNTYSREPVEALVMMQWYFQPAAFAGGGDIASLLQGLGYGPERTATLVGEETLLGRPVHVIEIRPGYSGTISSTDGTSEEYSGGVARMWLDKEFLFTLRMELPQDQGASTWTLRVTEIEFNGEVPDDLFQFEPPAGAV
ncbi:MAG: outer membrane lipoprotein carrier protein LolA, partial [Chloroflexi bacterium]|nr:outer membrane lipoprotein carrier protein LolA [Chloroflexota bacterium]